MRNITDQDYVIVNTINNKSIEPYDIVYHHSTIIDMLNTKQLQLREDEKIVCVKDLPASEQRAFSRALEDSDYYSKVDKVVSILTALNIDGDKMQTILELFGLDDQMHRQQVLTFYEQKTLEILEEKKSVTV
jgi:hypothetical protein